MNPEIWISCALEGFAEARQAQDRLHQEVSDCERAAREDRIRGFHVMDAFKRAHEMHVDEFSIAKLDQNQNVINDLMNKVQELQYDINCMHDSKDFKDAGSMHSGPLSHVPSESALLLPQADQGGLLSRAKNMQPCRIRMVHRETFLQVHLHTLRHHVPKYEVR